MRWLILTMIVACSSPSSGPKVSNTTPAQAAPDPQTFALRLIDVLERDDLVGWKALLSDNRRARLDDDTLHMQLETWRRDLLPKAHALRTADYSLDQSGPQHFVLYRAEGREPEALAMVIEEHGALRIDEN